MSTNDPRLNQIASDIRYCDDDRKKAQREIDYYNDEIEKLDSTLRSLQQKLRSYQDDLRELNTKYDALRKDQEKRESELEREAQSKQ